ncbi:MAG: Uma2 family endonuclease [Bacteroidia bacterium]
MSINPILPTILKDPALPAIFRSIKEELEKKAALREEYYALIHENVKAEFINGEIIYNAPVRRRHWRISGKLYRLLGDFVEKNTLGELGVEKVMIELTRNNYEPDICFFKKEKAQNFTDDQMLFPAPDFVVEIISKSAEKIDRGVKFIDYAQHGVQEYWLIDPEKETLEQYVLEEEAFQLLTKLNKKGEVSSTVIEDFSLGIESLWA